jgi:hypothetical protein
MEAAQGCHPPQLGYEDTGAPTAECGYLGVSMGGTSRAPFRATGTVQGDTIPLGSFLTAEAAARAYDRSAAVAPGCALNFPAGYGRSSAPAPYQRAALATQQRDDDDDDEPELLIVSDCQLTDSDWSDGDDDGDGMTCIERTARDSAQRKAPAAGIAHGSTADCAQYVGVTFDERHKAASFKAWIKFKSKKLWICCCPTAEAAARAYDLVACMIPGRKLNFPMTIPAAASSSRQGEGASAVPTESDILAAIADVRQAQQVAQTGAVKYFGVCIDKTRTRNPYKATVRIDRKQKNLGYHSTAEAAALAYDAGARTIRGHKLNFPICGSSVTAAAGGSRTGVRSLPSRGADEPYPTPARCARR